MKCFVATTICVSLIGVVAWTRSAATEPDPAVSYKPAKEMSDAVMAKVRRDEMDKVFEVLREQSVVHETEIAKMEVQTIKYRSLILDRFGKPVGVEFVRTEILGKSFVRFIYLEKFEKYALVWSLGFYKPDGEWKLTTVDYSDDLTKWYQTAA